MRYLRLKPQTLLAGFIIVAIAGIGVYTVVASHADSLGFRSRVVFNNRTTTIEPTAIVLHFSDTASDVDSIIAALKSNTNAANGGCASGCASQLAIDGKGRTYMLTPRINVQGAHACGINPKAIGIEIGGMNEQQLLSNTKQFEAVIKTVYRLQHYYNIYDINGNVGGKSGILSHQEVDKALCDTPSGKIDPGNTYMQKVRDGLRQEAKRRH